MFIDESLVGALPFTRGRLSPDSEGTGKAYGSQGMTSGEIALLNGTFSRSGWKFFKNPRPDSPADLPSPGSNCLKRKPDPPIRLVGMSCALGKGNA
jgi:hypothetical protein